MLASNTWWDKYELPTWLVAITIYTGWICLTLYHAYFPWWLLLLVGGYAVCWHGSLQHEALHGHPTRSKPINTALAIAPLSLWIPYKRYRHTHTTHHEVEYLTDPYDDPESFYCPQTKWSEFKMWQKRFYTFKNTLVGRLLAGPMLVCAEFWRDEAKSILSGNKEVAKIWIEHFLLCAVLFYWVISVCNMPLWKYIVCFAYPGLSLTLLRSFAEHRAAPDEHQRTAIVKAGWLAQLLYLNNNLHCIHHDNPETEWYKLPALYRSTADRYDNLDASMYYSQGYWEIVKKYLFKPVIPTVHPFVTGNSASQT